MYLLKNYLSILSILFLLIFIPSCFPYDNGGGGCGESILCESNNECVEEFGEDFICYKKSENFNKLKATSLINSELNNSYSCIEPENYCIEDICKTKNIDCGDGECSLIPYHRPGQVECICNETAKYIKTNEVQELGTIKKCLDDYTCETSGDCKGIYELIDNNLIEGSKCSSEGKCIQYNSK